MSYIYSLLDKTQPNCVQFAWTNAGRIPKVDKPDVMHYVHMPYDLDQVVAESLISDASHLAHYTAQLNESALTNAIYRSSIGISTVFYLLNRCGLDATLHCSKWVDANEEAGLAIARAEINKNSVLSKIRA